MKMVKIIGLILLTSLFFCSCYSRKIVPSTAETPPLREQKVIVTPLNPQVDYEIIGQVRVSGKQTSDIKGLYRELGNECTKMGGDMVINVKAGQDVQDTTKAFPLPRGYGADSFTAPYGPPYGMPYDWGTGTVIRIRDEDKRKAYQDAQRKDDPGEACAIVGLPLP